MNIGVVGLGKMGFAIAYRLLDAGHIVFGLDHNEKIKKAAGQAGITIVSDFKDMAFQTDLIWLMVPVSQVDNVIKDVRPYLKAGDIIIDGGNSFYKDSQRRMQELSNAGIFFLDCGTSGGVFGKKEGFCLMVGGDEAAYTKIYTVLAAIAMPGGLGHFGASGSGHYVKMVHNGIEYGILQAIGEGLMLIKEGQFKNEAIDLEELTRVWQNGSIIRSFLMELTHNVMKKNQELHDISGELGQGGTGKWTVEAAKEIGMNLPVIDASLKVREWSLQSGGDYATKVVAMLRHAFGGHEIKKAK